MTEKPLERARLLRSWRRYNDATAIIVEHLASAPDDDIAHLELALTRHAEGTNRRQALADVERAIALAPDSPAAHLARSDILNELGDYPGALIAARETKHLAPEMSGAWYVEARALLALDEFPASEQSARKALELNPDDFRASNLLSITLRHQGRIAEAETENLRNLARNPEHAWTFMESGWIATSKGQRDQAEMLFLEALRLDPNLEHARASLCIAYKERSRLYRFSSRCEEAFERLAKSCRQRGNDSKSLILIGFPFVLLSLLAKIHPFAILPIILFFTFLIVVAFGTLVARSLGHLVLLRDPVARMALNRSDKLDGLVVGCLFFGGLVALCPGIMLQSMEAVFVGCAMVCAAAPASRIFGNSSCLSLIVFSIATAMILCFGVVLSGS
jgi:tetratricopeptide (TPR) repeat protein